ncbi:DUF4041 domain-containing protein [Jeotgalibacillus haloalkalitolerans]|uniref:DUF4041 domain-containing protein n=1 Tax=Jeotgalibacillus haloalkalitolerans TaxID=3104292 RepID=A0ABU5KMX6_9BACL|nr:DUF4041 domain-containing protein [Jeotgalibacillus sp. HH7-29]MDZ5712612.1 DUF4041 domain-containing protein [Jeotgalibacillus sp. HH7-29]
MYKEKWYYSAWFISLLMAMWFLVLPLAAAITLLIFRQRELKEARLEWEKSGFEDYSKIKQSTDQLKTELDSLLARKQLILAELEEFSPYKDDVELKQKLKQHNEQLENEKETLVNQLQMLKDFKELEEKHKETESSLNELLTSKEQVSETVDILKSEIVDLEDEISMQSFGFYKPKYGFETSELYQTALQDLRNEQKKLVKEKRATNHSTEWTISNDKKKGREFILDTVKLILRAFNNECDNVISKVKFNNVEASEKRILKIFSEVNKLTDMQHVSITTEYLNLKLKELNLKYEFEQKKQEEKEEQAAIREQMREEAKALKELEKAKEKVEKEEKHFTLALEKAQLQLAEANPGEQDKLLDKIRELEKQLALTQKNKEDVLYRTQNTRAGYVYIISNIGSFGENVYKIGMTRRLEPLDRVKELGDASVPFLFDVHAMIFSDDAPTLENALHRTFTHRRVNLINERKEFFNVSLTEIETVVKENHNKTIQFTKLAIAEEYRQSAQMVKELVNA